jgi:hypothetical protein
MRFPYSANIHVRAQRHQARDDFRAATCFARSTYRRKRPMSELRSTASGSSMIGKLGRLARFLVFLCTAGWAFPHVCTEGMDLTQRQNEQMAGQA